MTNPIAIITGSSSGFGLLTVLELAENGYQVIATMRDLEKSTELLAQAKQRHLESKIRLHELDVTSEASVQSLSSLVESLDRIDVLVNNAGFAAGGFVEEIPLQAYRSQFETNFFGVIAVTKAVLPVMRKQGRGKIINVSSISGKVAFPGLSPYVASKHALEGWSESLRLEMKLFGVDVILIEPGSFQTSIWSSGKQVTEVGNDSPYYPYMKNIEHYLEAGEGKFGDPTEVAKKIADAARTDKPNLRFPIGKGVKTSISLRNIIPWKQWEKVILKTVTKGIIQKR